jgi:plasmid stabilization system protein ParE
MSEGLGERFEQTFFATLDRIVPMPTAYRDQFEGFRRVILKPFQYHLYFEVEPSRIVINAVLHARRDPQAIRERLARSEPSN